MTIPNLMNFVKDVKMDWDNIEGIFLKEIEEKKLKYQGLTNKLIRAKTICDYIVTAKMGKKNSRGLLFYINNLFKDLTVKLSTADKNRLAPNIRRIFTSKNPNSPYPEFLVPIGELAVLNGLLKSKKYEFKSIEHPLPNGKGIDFKLLKIEDGTEVLVEVVNIYLDTMRVENNDEAIKKLLTDRLTSKISNKKDGLTNSIDFFLVPVIWAEWTVLEIYCDYFKRNIMHLDKVEEPMAFSLLSDGNSFYVPRFAKISNLHESDGDLLEKEGKFYFTNLKYKESKLNPE